MSSNIKIQRICLYCGSEFTAKKTVSKTCSDNCAKRLYKQKQRAAKIEASNRETQQIISKPIVELKAKEFLTITETCSLLSISRWTIWRAIKRDELNAGKIGRRTLIRRSDLDKLFEGSIQPETIPEPTPKQIEYEISDCYTLAEVNNKFGISEKALYDVIRRNGIPKINMGRFTFVPKAIIDNLFS